jgi:hypothetical protein
MIFALAWGAAAGAEGGVEGEAAGDQVLPRLAAQEDAAGDSLPDPLQRIVGHRAVHVGEPASRALHRPGVEPRPKR